jgi:hypothetical protein
MIASLEESTSDLAVVSIPGHDLNELYRLTTRNQERVRLLLECFAIIERARVRSTGIAEAVEHTEGTISAKTIEALFYKFREGRDWRVAIKLSWEGSGERGLPDEFVAWLQVQVDKRQRKVEQGLKQARDAWRRGSSIPGYGTWREWFKKENPGVTIPDHCPGFPEGWHVRNLRRYLDSSKFRRVAQTIGRTAAKAHRSQVYTTRAGLWVMSHVQFDDLEHDFFCNSLQEKQAGRPLELFSHDLFSARKIRYGIRVKTVKQDGTANKLPERMMRMIVAATFYCDGYSPRGTEINAEHGTAAVREWLEKILLELSGGLITTRRSGFSGDAAHAGQYPGIRRGNPNFKASLESSNNLVHNILDHFPAQTGKDLIHRPEGLGAMLDHNADLLAAMQQMPPERAALLRLDILTVEQLMGLLQYYYGYLENDTDHELEGWEECGHIVQELNLAGRWLTQNDLLALPPSQHEMARTLLAAGQIATRPRRMSRREVWDSGASGLIKIPPYGVCEILGDDLSAERKVSDGMFEFEDSEVGPGVHRFDCLVETLDGHRMELRNGERFQAFVNPFAPDQLFVRDAKGRYIGVADRLQKPCRGNYAAVVRTMGAAAHREAALLAPLRDRHAEEVKERAANARHNSNVIEGRPVTPEEKALASSQARRMRKASGSLSDLTTEPEDLPEIEHHEPEPERSGSLQDLIG